MAVTLNDSLNWETAQGDDAQMLLDLQGNILDGHGRKATRHIFLRFGSDQQAALDFIHQLEPDIVSAQKQLDDAKLFRAEGISGGPFLAFLLSFAGYQALGVEAKAPDTGAGSAFRDGMLARAALLNDPPSGELEPAYRQPIHAMILIGADPDSPTSWYSREATALQQRILAMLPPDTEVVTVETGRAIFRMAEGGTIDTPVKLEGIEHFGYVDGRSQPLMLKQLVAREEQESDGTNVWNPEFPLEQVLVVDPGSPNSGVAGSETGFGSFFVFRKLEQDVAAFKAAEEAMGEDLGLGELAGAMLVGRFEDGTPVTLQREEGGDNPVMNNFDYAGDMAGLRCPFHAHIRKTNPRGDTERLFGAPIEQERSHIMARRGMTFGRRDSVVNPGDRPSGGVGLMFMSYQRSLEEQFEFTQASWANEPQFASGFAGIVPPPGRDPIIGQRGANPPVDLHVRDRWGWKAAEALPFSFEEHVRHRGGEYFFAPAKSTLASL